MHYVSLQMICIMSCSELCQYAYLFSYWCALYHWLHNRNNDPVREDCWKYADTSGNQVQQQDQRLLQEITKSSRTWSLRVENKKLSANMRVMPLVMPIDRMKNADHHPVWWPLGFLLGCINQSSNGWCTEDDDEKGQEGVWITTSSLPIA